jgi:hypothetical protein
LKFYHFTKALSIQLRHYRSVVAVKLGSKCLCTFYQSSLAINDFQSSSVLLIGDNIDLLLLPEAFA